MNNKKVAFITLGCKVNQYESNAMAQKFEQNGYIVCNENESPDIVVVNTCTVTNVADRKSRQVLRKVKEENKNAIVVAVRLLCASCKRQIRTNARSRYNFRKCRKSKYCRNCRNVFKRA